MGDALASGGRPESETDTPVNTGNGPYRDNGEGVAARPLPYPLCHPFRVFERGKVAAVWGKRAGVTR